MLTAILVSLVIWCTFYRQVPAPALLGICAGFGACLLWAGKRGHASFRLSIDVFAQTSRLNQVNPTLKLCTVLILMALCVSAQNPVVGSALAVFMLCLTVFVGGLKLRDYIQMLLLPVSFFTLSGFALLFELTAQKTGVLSFPIFSLWLSASESSQLRAALILSRALGAVSCLYFLSLTTPMSSIIGVLRRARCPGIVVSLMYLMYRYIFILLSMHHTMRDAAASRLGFLNYRTSIRTTARLYSGLLANSYRQAGNNFDAMESRCYRGEIRFLERRSNALAAHAATAVILIAATLGLTLWL